MTTPNTNTSTNLLIEAIGYIAAICTTINIFPQLYKTYRKRSAKDLSLKALIILLFGQVCWVIFGAFKNQLQLVIGNSINIVLMVTLIAMGIVFSREQSEQLTNQQSNTNLQGGDVPVRRTNRMR